MKKEQNALKIIPDSIHSAEKKNYASVQKNKNLIIFIIFQKNVFIRAETRIVYVWFILWESEAPVISMECEQDVMRLPLFGLFSHPQ